jgi:hypothetical protein
MFGNYWIECNKKYKAPIKEEKKEKIEKEQKERKKA